MPANRLPIPLVDYQRIFRVIKTVLDSTESTTARSCVFFSVAGALILQEVYKKQCFAIAGAAFIRVDDVDVDVISFADMDSDEITSTGAAFHCWIQCGDYIIDFMAPLFRESLQSAGWNSKCPRLMFQKPSQRMSASPASLVQTGDFYHVPNIALTQSIADEFDVRHKPRDLANICLAWYQKPPKKINSQFAIRDSLGNQIDMTLSETGILGSW